LNLWTTKMIESFDQKGLFQYNDSVSPGLLEHGTRQFSTRMSSARVFTFTANEANQPGFEPSKSIKESDKIEGVLDMPFRTMILEVPETTLVRLRGDNTADFDTRYVLCLMICELEFGGRYDFYSYECLADRNSDELPNFDPKLIYIPFNTSEYQLKKHYYSVTEEFLNRLNSKDVALGTEKTKDRVRIGKGKQRKIHKIREIIVVTNRQSKPSVGLGRNIDWSHRWEVRGHWRRFKGMGVDREGTRRALNMTWISNYVKGPENKTLVKKVRSVKSIPGSEQHAQRN